ncbi:MAG TPA: LamG-like jellyroll fold domain-containing protein [Bryobacteraceae bacterium]|nr:LamG-like jellyroll fold domain-containing protein [Bryobacteraceae bacterium]
MRSLLLVLSASVCTIAATVPDSLRPAMTLHANFDTDLNAGFARGDAKIYSAPDYKQQGDSKPGAGDVDIAIEKGSGVKGGGALRFRSKNTRALYFRGEKHVSLAKGTISFWLRLDPQKDLAPGFTDPIQITDKAYNDSAIWVDFTKDDVPRHFRLGVFGNLKAWNPTDIPPDKNPDFNKRLLVVERPPFSREKWTHIAITWTGLGANGSASLFLNGKRVSSATGIREAFTWEADKLAIRLGVSYVGLMDEVATFDRAFNESEISQLYTAGQ